MTFTCLTLTFSCNTKTSEQNKLSAVEQKKDAGAILTKFSVIDSLNRYIGTDSLYESGKHSFFVGRVNNTDIGIVQISDTSSIVYHRQDRIWNVTDTFNYPISYVSITDLNGDGYKDLLVTYLVTAAGANSQNVVLLFYPSSRQFEHNKYYDLPNIIYNKQKKKVFAAWWASAVHGQEKWSYRITGDSLTFENGVSYSPDEKSQGDIGTVVYYKMQGDQRIAIKKITGKASKTWDIFAKALWDTRDK